ncbi:hypothetical protein WBG99_13030 [Streptomyces sp. TG1A-60]|uniref:hypothetical protein n=1 Tax=Streptomyces sp. TG1A-60 TaxID=3129111 RepID=UPI0030CFADDF
MRSKISGAAVAVSVVAALGFTAACGGGSDEDTNAEPRPSAGATSAGDAQDGADMAGKAALTEARLKKAALANGDIKGYEIEEKSAAEMPTESVPSDPADCQPLADMFFFTSNPKAEARTGRTLTDKSDLTGTVVTLALLAHGQSDAEKVVADLRTATEKCAEYEQVGNRYTDVEALTAPEQGDEAVSYKLKGAIEGTLVPMSFTVVRSGSTLAAFYAMNILDADKTLVPDAVLEAQLAKLEKTAG